MRLLHLRSEQDRRLMMSVQDQRHPIQGLCAHEVEERRARGLGCVPPPATGRSYLRIWRENVLNTVNIILFITPQQQELVAGCERGHWCLAQFGTDIMLCEPLVMSLTCSVMALRYYNDIL